MPGSIPAYAHGPSGSTHALMGCAFDRDAGLLGPALLLDAERFLDANGEFNHKLYNYYFMLTIDKVRVACGVHVDG